MTNRVFYRFVLMVGMVLCWGVGGQPAFSSPASNLTLSVQDQRLTLVSHDASLFEIIERLAQAMSMKSHIGHGVEDTRVSLHLQDVSLQQGLDRVLANTNYVRTDKHLYIWSRNPSKVKGEGQEGSSKKSLPPETAPEELSLTLEVLKREALFAPDPETRFSALEALSYQDEKEVVPILAKALGDTDPEVRALALEMLGETEGPIPVDELAEVVRQDPSPEHRIEAMVVLASHDPVKAQSILQDALHDADPEIVELAKSILADPEFLPESEDLPF